jgi:murein DD-endopeptidase MepM/ murein hydrolase activator NlpD
MRQLRVLAALLFVALATIGLGGRALGEQSDKQQQLQQQVNESGAAAQTARSKLVHAQAERQRLDASVADVSARVAAANAELIAAQAEVDRLGFLGVVLQAKADATQKKLSKARDDVRHSALLLYQHGDGADMLGLLDSTDGSGQLVEGKQYMQRVSDKRRGDERRVTRLKAQLQAQQDDVAAQKQSADDARAQAADEAARLEELAAQQQRALAAAAGAVQAENAALDAAVTQQSDSEAALQEESDHIAALAQQAAAAESPAPSESGSNDTGSGGSSTSTGTGTSTFIWPVQGPITSPFGYRTDPVTGGSAFHAGLDIGASCGTPIMAAAGGNVVSAGFNSGGYGNMTLISHGNGLSTVYGHQSAISVSPGQSVSQGQVIGYVGSTGKSTGCHLHFEVRLNGNPVDPRGYL